jgi:hypothetical protein
MSELPQCRLDDCPPGLFLYKRGDHTTLGFKSEYSTDTSSMGKPLHQCDAYVVSSGEYFWGGAATGDERHALMVTPLDMETQSDNYVELFGRFAYMPEEL